MPSSVSSSTQTTVIGTEHTLATDTTNKVYVLVVDTAAMVGGTTPDLLELRVYTIALTSGTERLAYIATYAGPQTELIKYSPPVPADISFRATMKQTQGTVHAYPWKVLSL